MRGLPRAELVLPFLIVLGAVVLGASEFMIAFEFTPPGGEVQQEQTVADRHSYAMLVLSVFALIALVGAIAGASRPAAFAVAAAGGIALLMFLVLDLPDAGKIGPLEDFITAKAEPQIGFWLEAIGSVALGLGGAAFATLSSEQLVALRGRFGGGADEGPARDRAGRAAPPGASPAPAPATSRAEPLADPAAGTQTAVPLRRADEGDERSGRRGRRGRLRTTSRRPRPR